MTATVAWLAIAPVKGMRLQECGELRIDHHGAENDRRFAITDAAWHLVNGKHIPTLNQLRAEVSDETLALRFPDGAAVDGVPRLGDAATMIAYGRPRGVREVLGPWAEALSAFAGVPLRLVEPVLTGNGVDRGRKGAVSLLSLGSLERLAAAAGADCVDRRRFRMTVGVGGIEPFTEESWLGRMVTIGAVTVSVDGNVGRCAVTTAHPETGVVDLPTLHLLRGLRDGVPTTEPLPFGVWGAVVRPGTVRVGDEVSVA